MDRKQPLPVPMGWDERHPVSREYPVCRFRSKELRRDKKAHHDMHSASQGFIRAGPICRLFYADPTRHGMTNGTSLRLQYHAQLCARWKSYDKDNERRMRAASESKQSRWRSTWPAYYPRRRKQTANSKTCKLDENGMQKVNPNIGILAD